MLLRQMTGALGSTLTSIAFYTIVALFIQLTTGFESNILDTYTAWHSVKQYLSAPAVDIGVLFLLLVVISGCAALQPDARLDISYSPTAAGAPICSRTSPSASRRSAPSARSRSQ
jgi:hypothetical protein